MLSPRFDSMILLEFVVHLKNRKTGLVELFDRGKRAVYNFSLHPFCHTLYRHTPEDVTTAKLTKQISNMWLNVRIPVRANTNNKIITKR